MPSKLTLNNFEKHINCLLIAVSLLFIFISFIYQSGNVSPDSLNYFLQARDFWSYKVNFPLGYPFLIRLFSYFTNGDFFVASKIVNLLSYIFIILYCYKKKFFYNKSVFIFSFYPFILFYGTSLAEPVFFLILTIIVSKMYEISEGKIDKTIYFQLFLLFFSLVALKFTGIFVALIFGIFVFYLFFSKKMNLRNFILFSISIYAGIFFYLLINKSYCGFYLGKRSHLMLAPQETLTFIKERTFAFLSDFSFLKIIVHKKLVALSDPVNWIVGILTVLLVIFSSFRPKNKTFSKFLITAVFISLAAILYSYYTVKIDDNVRIKSLILYFIIFLIIINFRQKLILILKIMLIFLTSFNIATYLIYSVPYFDSYNKLIKIEQRTNSKHLNIIHNNTEEKNHSKVLLFKIILINKNIDWTENTMRMDNTVNILSKEITDTDN